MFWPPRLGQWCPDIPAPPSYFLHLSKTMYFCTIQTPIPARNGLYLWEPHTPRHHYHNNDALCSAFPITIPRNLLLQNNAVDARLEQRKHKARLALEVAQPVEDLGARVRGDGVKEMSELRGGQSPYFVFILPPRLVRLPQGIARGGPRVGNCAPSSCSLRDVHTPLGPPAPAASAREARIAYPWQSPFSIPDSPLLWRRSCHARRRFLFFFLLYCGFRYFQTRSSRAGVPSYPAIFQRFQCPPQPH